MSSKTPLDQEAIRRLRRLGDDRFVRDMIDLFFSYVSEKLSEARAAREAGDWPSVGCAAHAVKSTAGNAGASRVQDLATRLEQAAKAEEIESIHSLLPQLEKAFAEVKPFLEAARAELRDSAAGTPDTGG